MKEKCDECGKRKVKFRSYFGHVCKKCAKKPRKLKKREVG